MTTNNEDYDYNKMLDEKAEYEAEIMAEARERAKMEDEEAQMEYEHEVEIRNNPMVVLIEAIIEQQEKG